MEYGLVVLWLVAYLAIGLAALPLAATLFPHFDDSGASFGIPVGLAMLALVGHLVGYVAFGWPSVIVGVGALLAASALVGDREAIDERASLEVAAVFTVAFLFMIAIRSVTPAIAPLPIAIGEKFLDFGLIQTSLRADALPPEDMWFAGEPVRYHYGGHLLTALLTVLTGTASRFAYNLALAGFYATLVTGAYGIAGTIAAEYDVHPRAAAGLGAFFVGIAGNLHTAGLVAAWLLPDSIVGAIPGLDPGGAVVSWTPADFWYFDASRIVPVHPGDPDATFSAATEFPLLAWLNGDLHAHMMSQPFMLLAVALLFAYWQADEPDRTRPLLIALPPVVGLVAMINLWSLPTALGLTALVVALAPGDPATSLNPFPHVDISDRITEREDVILEEIRRVGLALGATLFVLVGALVWTTPFWIRTVVGGPGQSMTYWGSWTPIGPLLLVHGAFVFAIAVYLARRLAATDDRITPGLVLLVAIGILGATTALGSPALGMTLPIIAVGWWLLRQYPDVGFPVVLAVAGAGLVLLVELVNIEGERFNVIFKPYVHVWLFWSVATAVILPRLAIGWPTDTLDIDRHRLRQTGAVLLVAIVAVTGLYAGFAIPAHFDTDPVGADGPTLDGTAYTHATYPEEAQAIEWLHAREGQPTIVTAAPGGYWWVPEDGNGASAPASLTGLPTVLGWFHEAQYRGREPYQQRLEDVTTIYEGSIDEQTDLFEAYDVRYVYVGPVERNAYEDLTVTNHPDLEVAFREGDVVIYEVRG
jgi:YYY domain-containing protein